MSQTETARESNRDLGFARFSYGVERALSAALVLIPILLFIYAMFFSSQLARHPWIAALDAAPTSLPPLYAFAAFLVLLVSTLPLLFSLFAAIRLFHGYATGRVFTVQAADRLRDIALGLLVAAGLQPVGSLALSAVIHVAGNTRSIAFSLGTETVWLALFGLIVLGIARVMRQAATMAEDHAAIV